MIGVEAGEQVDPHDPFGRSVTELRAYDRQTGELRWSIASRTFGVPNRNLMGPPVVASHHLVMNTGQHLQLWRV